MISYHLILCGILTEAAGVDPVSEGDKLLHLKDLCSFTQMDFVEIMTCKDVDMDEEDDHDLEYDELALGSSKRRRKGSGSFSFTFSSTSSNVVANDASSYHPFCSCHSADARADKTRATTTLHFQCLVPAVKIRDCQASADESHGRAHSFCHKYGPASQAGPVLGERNLIAAFPATVDRDKHKKWICKNDLYEFRTSKYHQSTRNLTFLDRLRAAQAASACTPSQCSET